MTYRPHDRPMTAQLAKQIAKQQERIKACTLDAYMSYICKPDKSESFYSKRFKNGTSKS